MNHPGWESLFIGRWVGQGKKSLAMPGTPYRASLPQSTLTAAPLKGYFYYFK
jgi:hypothetical protein